MQTLDRLISDINKRSLKVIGNTLFPENVTIQTEKELLEWIHRKWIQLYMHPQGRILSVNWLQTYFSSQQLKDAKIYLSGVHVVKNDDATVGGHTKIIHFGEGKIYASNKSDITDYGNGVIYAGDESIVHAYYSKRIFAKGYAHILVHTTRPVVRAYQQAVVNAESYVTVKAHGCVHITCMNGGNVIAKNNSFVEMYSDEHRGRVELYDKSIGIVHGTTEAFVADRAVVNAYDSCIVDAEDQAIVHVHDNAKATISCEARIYREVFS